MRKFLTGAGLALGVMASTGMAEAESLKGVWSSGNAASLEILAGNKVKYCFIKQCTKQSYKGQVDGTISFSWGPDHHYKFTKTSSGYHGVYNDDQDMTIEIK